MSMTEKEFRNEYLYNSTMFQVGRMLEMGMITDEDYCRINTKMKAKYLPASGGLVSEVWRMNRAKRA